ncbi:methyltransferase domain-containing protein [Acidicapsa dinghuensis]|uniref:Methyltransferase domain-containing protein n=1 Tax=Acidicapsa dinghuensis TaxID=2218256 RepID=A0ABW1ELT8_9BACT|nr:methyltransferase domain-containing protein [Acidicapsa dinghuensis]
MLYLQEFTIRYPNAIGRELMARLAMLALMHTMGAIRLQLGTSRLEKLSKAARALFIDPSWIHLGDPPQPILERIGRILLRGDPIFTRSLYRGTDFREFFFRAGERLPFDDQSFTFIYSEHFFEHLPLTLAGELMRECHRLLKVGGVLRTVVPDAVLPYL